MNGTTSRSKRRCKIKEAAAEPVEVVAVSRRTRRGRRGAAQVPGQGRGPRDSRLGCGHRGLGPDRDRASARGGGAARGAGLLFAGVQSSDQAFASTGIAAAALLDWPHAAVVSSLGYSAGARSAPCSAASSEGGLLHEMRDPVPGGADHSARHQHAALRLAAQHQAGRRQADRGAVPGAISGLRASDVGEAGSLSRVRRMYIPDKGRAQLIEGDASRSRRARLAQIIREFKGERGMSGVLVIAEQRRGELRPATLELIERRAIAAPRHATSVAVAILADGARAVRRPLSASPGSMRSSPSRCRARNSIPTPSKRRSVR